jgi:hypothetical protein
MESVCVHRYEEKKEVINRRLNSIYADDDLYGAMEPI